MPRSCRRPRDCDAPRFLATSDNHCRIAKVYDKLHVESFPSYASALIHGLIHGPARSWVGHVIANRSKSPVSYAPYSGT